MAYNPNNPNGQSTAANSAPVVLASNQTAIPVTQSGTWTVQPGNTANTTPWLVRENNPATATRTQVTSSTTAATILALNTNRRGAMIYNNSTANLYLGLGATTVTTTNFTVLVLPNGYYELPTPVCTALVTGVWAAANGTAQITETT